MLCKTFFNSIQINLNTTYIKLIYFINMGLFQSSEVEILTTDLYKQGCTIDLETTFLSKGYRRTDQRILEIGAVSLDTLKTFNVLVHPFEAHLKCGKDLIHRLIDMGQQAMPTIDFWITILEKKQLIRKVKRSNEIKADYIANLINQNIYYEDKHTKGIKRKERLHTLLTRNDRPKIFMVTDLTALSALQRFTTTYGDIWYAHNGKSFDYKILDASAKRLSMHFNGVKQLDTLHMFKKQHPGLTSYAQPKLYEHFEKGSYTAHIALDDAKALQTLLKHIDINDTTQKSMKKTNTGLQSIKFCGPKTEALLQEKGVCTIEQLKQKVKEKPTWLKEIGVRQHKKIKEQLI